MNPEHDTDEYQASLRRVRAAIEDKRAREEKENRDRRAEENRVARDADKKRSLDREIADAYAAHLKQQAADAYAAWLVTYLASRQDDSQ